MERSLRWAAAPALLLLLLTAPERCGGHEPHHRSFHHPHHRAWADRHGDHHEEHHHHHQHHQVHHQHHHQGHHHVGFRHHEGHRGHEGIGMMGHGHHLPSIGRLPHHGHGRHRILSSPDNVSISAACNWTVYYDSQGWTTPVHVGEKEAHSSLSLRGPRHFDRTSGAVCLDGCCHDPECHGLSMASDLQDAKCSHYSKAPDLPAGGPAETLEEFLAWGVQRPRRPSAFVKTSGQGAAAGGAGAALLISPRPHTRALVAEVDGSGVHPMKGFGEASCNWTVHHDVRVEALGHHIYDHGAGIAGCVELCCHDPTCKGLQMVAPGHSACYELGALPLVDVHNRPLGVGRPLGNAGWLHSMPHRWTTFVKGSGAAAASTQAPAIADAVTNASVPPASSGAPREQPHVVRQGGLGLGPQVRSTRSGAAHSWHNEPAQGAARSATRPSGGGAVEAALPPGSQNVVGFQLALLLLAIFALAKLGGGKRAGGVLSAWQLLRHLCGSAGATTAKCTDL